MFESVAGVAISAVDLESSSSVAEEQALVVVTSRRGIIVYANDRFCEVSGYSRQELVGVPHSRVGSGRHSHRFWRDLWQTIGAGRLWRGEICNCAHDGTEYWLDCTIRPLRRGDEAFGYIAVSRLMESTPRRPGINTEAAQPSRCATGWA